MTQPLNSAELYDRDSPLAHKIREVFNTTECSRCRFDEADGSLIGNCDRCCRKISNRIANLVFPAE